MKKLPYDLADRLIMLVLILGYGALLNFLNNGSNPNDLAN